jgi:hypothetical protein
VARRGSEGKGNNMSDSDSGSEDVEERRSVGNWRRRKVHEIHRALGSML